MAKEKLFVNKNFILKDVDNLPLTHRIHSAVEGLQITSGTGGFRQVS